MEYKQGGFSLIELMMVIAILGILLSVAVPEYQEYTTRAKIFEGLQLAASAKTAVAEYFQTMGAFPTSNEQAGLSPTIAGKYVKSVGVGKEGEITITYGANAGTANDATIVLKPEDSKGSLLWSCDGGSVQSKFRPANCRDGK